MVNAPEQLPDAEQEAEEMGLTGKAKELYPDWQHGKIETEDYVRKIIDEIRNK